MHASWKCPAKTRQNLTLLNQSTGVYTKINEPGPTIGPEHMAGLFALVDELAPRRPVGAVAAACLPARQAGFYADLVAAVQGEGGRPSSIPARRRCAWGWLRGRPHQGQEQRGSGPGFRPIGIQR